MNNPKERTLRQRLNAKFFTTLPDGQYRRRVIKDGKVVFAGFAYDISLWLNRQGVAP